MGPPAHSPAYPRTSPVGPLVSCVQPRSSVQRPYLNRAAASSVVSHVQIVPGLGPVGAGASLSLPSPQTSRSPHTRTPRPSSSPWYKAQARFPPDHHCGGCLEVSRRHLGEDPYSILSLLEPQLHLGHHLLCPLLLSPSLSPEEPSPAPPKSQGTSARGTVMVRIPAVAPTASSPQLTAEIQLGPQPSPQEARRGRGGREFHSWLELQPLGPSCIHQPPPLPGVDSYPCLVP